MKEASQGSIGIKFHSRWGEKNLSESKKNVQILQTCFCMHDCSLFKLYSNVKAWVFLVNCFSQFIGRGFTNHSKNWIYLRNNVVHYHFSLPKLTAALNLWSVIKTHLKAHPRSSCFRGNTRKGKFFTRKVWSPILRQLKHWFVFSLEGPIIEVVYLARNVPWLREGRNPTFVIRQFDVIDEKMKKNDELSSIALQRILLACCNITVSGTCYRILSGTRYRVLVQNALQLHGNFGVPLVFPQCSAAFPQCPAAFH